MDDQVKQLLSGAGTLLLVFSLPAARAHNATTRPALLDRPFARRTQCARWARGRALVRDCLAGP